MLWQDTHFRYKNTNRFNIKVLGKDTPLVVAKKSQNSYIIRQKGFNFSY